MTEPDGLDYGYDSFLGQVPESLRDQIEPAFKSYSEDIKTKVAGQYGQFEPFKEILDNGWTPEHVNVGLNLLQQLNDNPQSVYQALVQQYPELAPQPQQIAPVTPQGPGSNSNSSDYDIPPALQERLDAHEKLLELLGQGFNQQQQNQQQFQQAEQEQQELAQFKAQLDQVAPENKYPRQFILSYVANGQSPQEAVASFEAWRAQELNGARSAGAPLIAPAGGGGLPSEPLDTAKLTESQRKELITKYLETANQQG